jgi:hypothetical protein
MLAAGAAISSLVSAMTLGRTNRETSLAMDAAQNAVERLQGESVFSEVFVRFNATTADDPPVGPSPGWNFAVPGLNIQPGDPDGFAGQILFPGDGVMLLEGPADPELGLPRDLNGDGLPAPDGIDHAADYNVLPVRIRVDWTGASGNRRIEILTVLANT